MSVWTGPPEPELVVAADSDALARHVADRLLATITAAQRARGTASVVVTGGRVMAKVLTTLATSEARDAIDWPQIDIWWADERWVPAGSPERNDIELDGLLEQVPVPPDRVHRMPPSDGAFSSPGAAAESYAAELAASAKARREPGGIPHFDAVLLGVGEDGHCASLFPEAPGTYVTDQFVIAVHGSPKPPPVRLSMTFPALDAAEQVWFVTAGSAKADAVTMALAEQPGRIQVPASGPRGRKKTMWLIDRDAAAKLPRAIWKPPVS